MAFDLKHAKQFLAAASLPPVPLGSGVTDGMGMPELETTRKQSLVVGSNVVSFTIGVEADVRQAITDSSLFAQLAAAHEVGTNVYPDPEHGLMAKAMAFSLKADNTLTQVLFFKLQKGHTSLRRSTGSLSIDAQAMKTLRPQLAAKMNDYRSIYIADVEFGTL